MRSKSHDVSQTLDTLIARQQELAAKFARSGKKMKARAARSKLMILLNQRDMNQTLLACEGSIRAPQVSPEEK